MLVRTLRKGGCLRLYDVSPVTYPAYDDTTVTSRSLDEFMKNEKRGNYIYAADDYQFSDPSMSEDMAFACYCLQVEMMELCWGQEYLRKNPNGALRDYALAEVEESATNAKMLIDFITANGGTPKTDAMNRAQAKLGETRTFLDAQKAKEIRSTPNRDYWAARLGMTQTPSPAK